MLMMEDHCFLCIKPIVRNSRTIVSYDRHIARYVNQICVARQSSELFGTIILWRVNSFLFRFTRANDRFLHKVRLMLKVRTVHCVLSLFSSLLQVKSPNTRTDNPSNHPTLRLKTHCRLPS